MGTGKLLGKPNKLWGNDLRWTSIPSRGSRDTPSRFMLQKLGVSSSSYGPVGFKASFRKVDVLIIYFFVGDTDVK